MNPLLALLLVIALAGCLTGGIKADGGDGPPYSGKHAGDAGAPGDDGGVADSGDSLPDPTTTSAGETRRRPRSTLPRRRHPDGR